MSDAILRLPKINLWRQFAIPWYTSHDCCSVKRGKQWRMSGREWMWHWSVVCVLIKPQRWRHGMWVYSTAQCWRLVGAVEMAPCLWHILIPETQISFGADLYQILGTLDICFHYLSNNVRCLKSMWTGRRQPCLFERLVVWFSKQYEMKVGYVFDPCSKTTLRVNSMKYEWPSCIDASEFRANRPNLPIPSLH